jgi:HD-like signal output (HDOD) protein/GGDEF domain-containing protein
MSAVAVEHSVGLIQQFVERTSQLYSLPAVAAELLRLTAEDQVTPRQLRACLERDPALATRVLRVVNSSLMGVGRPIADLGQALAVLGIRPLRMLVLGFSLPRECFVGLEAEVLADFWRGSLRKAIAARELAEQFWHQPGDEPFLAGLVQDIGMLVLVQQLGAPYQTLVQRTRTLGGSLLDSELEILGFDHLVLSSRLLTHWGLPSWLCQAVAIGPDEARIAALQPHERPLPQMLHLAHLLHQVLDQPHGGSFPALCRLGAAYCGLSAEQLVPLVQRLQAKVAELAEVLRLELADGQSYVSLLLEAQQRLAEATLQLAPQVAQPVDEELLALAQRLQSELAAACERSHAGTSSASFASPTACRTRSGPEREGGQPPAAEAARRGTTPQRTTHHPSPPSLLGRVAAAIARCRQQRIPLSLALFEIDHFSDRLLVWGPTRLAALLHALAQALPEWSGLPATAWPASDSQLAVLWDDTSRSDAVAAVRTILSRVKPWVASRFPEEGPLTLSAGVAAVELITRNFSAETLVQAAQRCLSGAQLSGGDTVKSIAF